MKKEISTPIAVVAVALLVVVGWFLFQSMTGPIRSASPSPDATKMTAEEIQKIRQHASPDAVH